MTTVKVTTYLPEEVHTELQADAHKNGRSVAGTVRWVVERYLADQFGKQLVIDRRAAHAASDAIRDQ